jgi:peroxiredoxin
MKKIIIAILLVLSLGVFISYAAELKVGDKVSDFKLSAALDNKEYSLSSPEFAGKVVYAVYASTSSADDNDHVSDALNANKDIKQVAKHKQLKTGAIILLDPDFTIGNRWGVPHKIATSVLVDKERVVRYIYSGKTPAENIPKIIDLIKKYSEAK